MATFYDSHCIVYCTCLGVVIEDKSPRDKMIRLAMWCWIIVGICLLTSSAPGMCSCVILCSLIKAITTNCNMGYSLWSPLTEIYPLWEFSSMKSFDISQIINQKRVNVNLHQARSAGLCKNYWNNLKSLGKLWLKYVSKKCDLKVAVR